VTSNEGICLVACAEAGMGMLFLSDHLVRTSLERGTLVKVPVDVELSTLPVSALYRREYLTPVAREFLDLLIEYMEAEYPRNLAPPG
jgi:DNA-binding transcriptional LysR family regulator